MSFWQPSSTDMVTVSQWYVGVYVFTCCWSHSISVTCQLSYWQWLVYFVGHSQHSSTLCRHMLVSLSASAALSKAGVVFSLCVCLSVCLSVSVQKTGKTTDQKYM